LGWIVVIALAACTGVAQRFPDDVQTTLAHSSMRRLESDRFIIYYPGDRRAEVDRFLARASYCVDRLRDAATIKSGEWAEKMVIVMPDVAFNNAFVLPAFEGYEQVSIIPLQATLDFATEFGLPPDPGYIACHELTHYVHFQQLSGFWSHIDDWFGHLYTPQLGYDAWFFEGLATHYESALSPGVGRPHWPIFTGMFAAGYAGEHVGGGDLSSFNRLSHLGHHYLVGAMFFRFLGEKYGEKQMWATIADESHAFTGWFWNGTFKTGFGVSFSDLIDQFDDWKQKTFPVRTAPMRQKHLATLGNDARYARGVDGTEAWVADDLDLPPRLVVRDHRGNVFADDSLVDIFPPRKLVQADPLVVSGLSVTSSGEVWLTVIDAGATFQIPRLLRWTRDGGLEQIADNLGPGGSISPDGKLYYYCWVDGDSWSLAAYDVHAKTRRFVYEAPPGVYVLTAQVSPDGKRIAASVWDGHQFSVWELDATTGQRRRSLAGYDPSFMSDGRLMYLHEVDGRFQVFAEGVQMTDAPYAVLNAREAHGTIRFMDREKWEWELAEVSADGVWTMDFGVGAAQPALPTPQPPPASVSDEPYSSFDHLFYPQQRSPTFLFPSSNAFMYGGVLSGGDRLGLQRWSLAGYFQPETNRTYWGGEAAYLNTMLAPVSIEATGSLLDWADEISDSTTKTKTLVERQTRDASLTAAYLYRNSLLLAAGGVVTTDRDPFAHRALAGPQAAFQWYSNETTRYTGDRRAILVAGSTAFYPHQASTFDGDITDIGTMVGTIMPLPFGRRHSLRLLFRTRALVSPTETGLLQLGGDSGLAELYSHSSVSETPPAFDDSRMPPGLRFVEPLRGYEDYAITTDRAEIVDVGWRYPIIIDKGVATTSHFLPTSFLEQFDLEMFANGAFDKRGKGHGAVGTAIAMHFQLLRVPLVLTYQLARRMADDKALTQLVVLGPGP